MKGLDMTKRMLDGRLQEKISELRGELDDWGDPRWSYREIAELLGLSESTVWRAANRSGSYKVKNPLTAQKKIEDSWNALLADDKGVLEIPTSPLLAREAAQSQERLLALLEREKFLAPSPDVAERLERYGVRKAPLSPLEGGEYPGEGDDQPPSGLTRLTKEADEVKRLAEGGV
jgi:transcriptional regulator with XRE-family HTH domain